MMTLKRKIEIGAFVAALALAAFLFKNWLDAHDAMVHAQATVAASEDAKKTIDAAIADLKATQAAKDAETKQEIAAIGNRVGAAQSPQQIAELVAGYMGLKQPITFQTPAPTAENPHPTPQAVISTDDTPQIKAYVQECETCKVALPAANAKALNLNAQLQQMTAKDAEDAKEAATWKTAAKGTFWSNTKRAGKWTAIGVGIGVVACAATGKCK